MGVHVSYGARNQLGNVEGVVEPEVVVIFRHKLHGPIHFGHRLFQIVRAVINVRHILLCTKTEQELVAIDEVLPCFPVELGMHLRAQAHQ
jgi:hypothetical protein